MLSESVQDQVPGPGLEEPGPRHYPKWRLAVQAVICLLILLYVYGFCHHTFISAYYPFQLDNGEGYLLDHAHWIAEGKQIYRPLTDYPYSVANYPPLFLVLNALFIKLGAYGFTAGRLMNVFLTLGIGGLLAILVYMRTKDPLSAWIAVGFWLSAHLVRIWAPYFRVDVLGIFFSLLGVILVAEYAGKKRAYLSILCFLLALYTKQSLIAAPLAAYGWLLFRDRKQAIRCIAYLLGIGLSIFLYINIQTGGQFWQHLVVYNANAYYFHDAMIYQFDQARYQGTATALAVIYLVICLKNKDWNCYCAYVVTAYLFSFSAGKIGSAPNYMLETIMMFAAASGLAVSYMRNPLKGKASYIAIPLVLLHLLAVFFLPASRYDKFAVTYTRPGMPSDIEYKADIAKLISSIKGEVISDDSGLALFGGKEVLLHPFIMSQLANQGLWDETPVVDDIRDKRFKLIITYFRLEPGVRSVSFSQNMIKAMQQSYILMKRVGNYYLYVPDPKER